MQFLVIVLDFTYLSTCHVSIIQGYSITPLVAVKLELLQNDVSFVPALDSLTSDSSIPETVKNWLTDYLQACGQVNSWRKDHKVCGDGLCIVQS